MYASRWMMDDEMMGDESSATGARQRDTPFVIVGVDSSPGAESEDPVFPGSMPASLKFSCAV